MEIETALSQQVMFHMAGQRHALPVARVERVIRMVEVTPLPTPQPPIMGVINLQGQIVPVINTRQLFHVPDREIELADQMIVIKGSRGTAVLWVDPGVNVQMINSQQITPGENLPESLQSVSGVIRDAEGMILLHEVDGLLSCLAGWNGGRIVSTS